jgi:two-component system sensor histidine kinase BaeS
MNSMRSIAVKLLLAFLLVSSISVLLIVFSVRWMTEREFKSYLFDQDQSSIVSTLTEYYTSHGTWDGVETALFFPAAQPPPRGFVGGRWFFTLVDGNDRVVLAGPGDIVGSVLPPSIVAGGVAINVNGITVGTMVTRQPDISENAADTAFLNRIRQIYTLSAIGVIVLALLLAFLLSRTLTRPIRELTAATRAVSAGKPPHEVLVRSRDELGELAASFNQMYAELARSTELRRQMTADIAHELRTPVSVILGHSEAVHDGVLPPSLETFEIIRDEAARLENLIEDLRTLSRADAGELPIELRPVALEKLLQNVCAVHNHRAAQKNITLQVQVASDLPSVSMDPGRMMQVLNNLVDNALRYTPAGGSVKFSALVVDKMLEIRVQDSGVGIAEAELDRVFDRFYRADPSRQREEGGSGLGLAIARSIVEKHNGRIWAESRLGQGTTIVIHLPIAG